MKIDGQDSRHILVPSYNIHPLEKLIQGGCWRSDCYFLDEEAVDPLIHFRESDGLPAS